MPLHVAKKTALLNSLNCITSNDLSSLKDLSDGSCLYNILSTTFEESSDCVKKCESDTSVSEAEKIVNEKSKAGSVDTVVSESGNVALSEDPFGDSSVESKNADIKESSSEYAVEQMESPDGVDEVILQRFKFIQNYIDRRYNLKSDEIISYSKCIKANDFELAKVAAFILSEVVKHFVLVNNAHLSTFAHFDVRIQEDLEECFHLFIARREEITKKDVEKILSNHAKYKSLSPKSPFATPRRNCASKYKVDFSTTPTNEEIYTNSPLKSFFESFDSPVFKKEDIMQKDKEIAKVRNNLYEEEIRAEELRLELTEAKKTIELKDKEIAHLKASRKMQESDKSFRSYEDELKELKEKYDNLKKECDEKCKRYEAGLDEYEKEKSLLLTAVNSSRGIYYSEDGKDLCEELIQKERLIEKQKLKIDVFRNKQVASFIEFDSMKNKLAILTEELNYERQKSSDIEIQSAKNRKLFAAQLAKLKKLIKKESESPGIGENILTEENRILQLELNAANLKNKQLEEALNSKQVEEEKQENVINSNLSPFGTNIVDSMALTDTVLRSKEMYFSEISTLKKRYSDKSEELNDSLAECDMLSNSEVAFKESYSSSLHSVVNNMPEPPVLKDYGALWKNANNSYMEIDFRDHTAHFSESSDQPESCDKILNLCCKCNMPNKNGYNFNTVFAQQLKQKDEEIARLKNCYDTLEQESTNFKAKCNTLELQSEDYLSQIAENNRIIESLKLKLRKAENACKELYEKCEEYKERLASHEEKVKKYDFLYDKYTEIGIKMKKRESSLKYEYEVLRKNQRKSDQQILFLKGQLSQLYRRLENEEQKNKKLKKIICSSGRSKNEKVVKKMDTLQKRQYINMSSNSNHGKDVEINPEKTKEHVNLKSESIFVDYNTDASKDLINESTVSGALLRKNGISFDNYAWNPEDEDSFFNHTSLPCPSDQEKRVEELIRRNSILPHHLQSSYPIEMNLKCSAENFYVKNIEGADNGKFEISDTDESLHSNHYSKKRKIQEVDAQSIDMPCTPVNKILRTIKRPSSLKKLLDFKRERRNGSIKPKP